MKLKARKCPGCGYMIKTADCLACKLSKKPVVTDQQVREQKSISREWHRRIGLIPKDMVLTGA